MKLIILSILSIGILSAQTQTHGVTLAWGDVSNPTGTTYNVYRTNAVCPVSLGGVALAGPPLASNLNDGSKSYTDKTVIGGQTYCYAVTAVIASTASKSIESNQVVVQIVVPNAFVVSNLVGAAW